VFQKDTIIDSVASYLDLPVRILNTSIDNHTPVTDDCTEARREFSAIAESFVTQSVFTDPHPYQDP